MSKGILGERFFANCQAKRKATSERHESPVVRHEECDERSEKKKQTACVK